MTRDDVLEILKYLPCSKACFEGEKTWETGHCLEKRKCEYINGMWCFIVNCYSEYQIVKCLDVDKNNLSQPEALLKNDSGDYMAIEMKNMPDPQFLESSVEETDEKNEYDCSFWKKCIDDSTRKAKETFAQGIKKKCPDISQTELETVISIFFSGMNVNIFPKENNLSVRELAYKEREEFKAFLIRNMVDYSNNLLRKGISGKLQEEDVCRRIYFKDKLELHFVCTKEDFVYFQVHDTVPFSLRKHLEINEKGVTDYLRKFLDSCDKKFTELNKEIHTQKNIFLLTHESTLSEATNVIEKCLKNLSVPKSIHEIWVTDYHYESVYNIEGEEIGEKITEYKYRKIYTQ